MMDVTNKLLSARTALNIIYFIGILKLQFKLSSAPYITVLILILRARSMSIKYNRRKYIKILYILKDGVYRLSRWWWGGCRGMIAWEGGDIGRGGEGGV